MPCSSLLCLEQVKIQSNSWTSVRMLFSDISLDSIFIFFKGNYCFCQIVVNWKLTVFDKSSSCCVCDWCSGSSGGDWADIWTGTDVAACGVGLRHNQPSLPAGQDLPRPHHCVRQDFITKGTAPLLLCICVQSVLVCACTPSGKIQLPIWQGALDTTVQEMVSCAFSYWSSAANPCKFNLKWRNVKTMCTATVWW